METAERLALARQLVAALETGNEEQIVHFLRAIQDVRSTPLIRHLAELTRDVHQSLLGISADPQLVELTKNNMPDARNRLSYVIEKTEDSAHRTLAAVEDMMPLAERLASGASAQVLGGDPVAIRAYVNETAVTGEVLRGGLTEVLMAQEFQDLTGQVIRRTIDLVGEVEKKLVALITSELPAGADAIRASGPNGVNGPALRTDVGAVHHQDDVDALLAELGV
jgi:chemotaxis protein CheZ